MELIERIIPKFKNSKAVVATKSKLKKVGYDGEGITVIEWGMLILLGYLCMFSFSYVDLQTIMNHTVTFVRSIIHGNWDKFYELSISAKTQEWAANYEPIVYLLMAFLNFPVVIADIVFDVKISESLLAVLWEKAILVIFAVLSSFVVKKIFKEVGLTQKRMVFGQFLFLSSLYTIIITVVQSQIEIIIIYLILLGIYYYIKDDYNLFVLFFALSIPLKMISVLVFIPLVLLKYKSILKILISLVFSVSFLFIFKLPYMNNEVYSMLTGANSKLSLVGFGSYDFPFNNKKCALFIFGYVCLCVYCYIKNISDKSELIYITSFTSLLVMGGLVLLFTCSSYWFVLLVPFIVLITMQNRKYLAVNLLLEAGMSLGWMVSCFTTASAFTNLIRTGREIGLMKMFKVDAGMEYSYAGVHDFLISKNIDQYTFYFYTLLVACFVMFCVLNLPHKRKNTGDFEKIKYSFLWIRSISFYVALIFVFCIGIAQNPIPVYNTMHLQSKILDYKFETSKTTIEQNFVADKDFDVSGIVLTFDLKSVKRSNVNAINVEILNSNGEVLGSSLQSLYLLPDRKEYTFKFDNVSLEQGQSYSVVLTQKFKNLSNNYGYAKVFITQGLSSSFEPCTYNGYQQSGSLYMKIQ